MDKFDHQIAMLKPALKPAKLDERQFMLKLTAVKRMQRQRRASTLLLALTAASILLGMFIRDIMEVVTLTLRYITDLPALFTAFSRAYIATISWPSVIAILLSIAIITVLFRRRKALPTLHDRKIFNYAPLVGAIALVFSFIGLFGGSNHALAQQEALRRSLNERGHLEVRVNNKDFELYSKSEASDASIRNQATIEQLRSFDVSKAYPDLKNLNRDGFVTEIREIRSKDDCVFYVERRLEPALNKVMDANSGCINDARQPIYYLSAALKPIGAPKWKVGQAAYFSNAKKQDGGPRDIVGVVILLDGKADDYVARQTSEKIVPEGQQGAGTQSCGIDFQDVCPEVGGIDVLMNDDHHLTGEIGSAVTSDLLRPRAGTQIAPLFGKITALNSSQLQLELINGKRLTVTWPRNYIADFNAAGAKYYRMTDGPLKIGTGDYLTIEAYYKDGMDLQQLSISDIRRIVLALKTTSPDPLSGETYDKAKAMEKTEKYRP